MGPLRGGVLTTVHRAGGEGGHWGGGQALLSLLAIKSQEVLVCPNSPPRRGARWQPLACGWQILGFTKYNCEGQSASRETCGTFIG